MQSVKILFVLLLVIIEIVSSEEPEGRTFWKKRRGYGFYQPQYYGPSYYPGYYQPQPYYRPPYYYPQGFGYGGHPGIGIGQGNPGIGIGNPGIGIGYPGIGISGSGVGIGYPGVGIGGGYKDYPQFGYGRNNAIKK